VLNTLNWKSVLMIWGGPLLTIVSLYILAAQLGWLGIAHGPRWPLFSPNYR
jgi:hypothetical protein